MGLDALRRITDLFDEGKELVLRDGSTDGQEPVLIWVNKLNSFEVDEARQDGAAARARLILALKEIGTDEQSVYEASLDEMRPEAIKETLLNQEQTPWMVEAVNELRVDPDWIERVSVIERQGALAEMTDAEREVVAQINTAYLEELQARVEVKRQDAQRELLSLDLAGLKERHRTAWIDNQGMAAFSSAYRKTQVYYALRQCSARVKNVHGAWDHSTCDHTKRLCGDRDDVGVLPDTLFERVLTSLREQSMPATDARFSAGAASSSAPSPQPSEAEESTASTPEVTSAEPAMT